MMILKITETKTIMRTAHLGITKQMEFRCCLHLPPETKAGLLIKLGSNLFVIISGGHAELYQV
jgi:hypothetical protein